MRLQPVLLAAVLLSGCHDTTTPAAPSNAIVERFSGTVEPGRADTKTFTSAADGEIRVTLQALTPGAEVVGIFLGGFSTRIGVTGCVGGQHNVVTRADVGKPVLLTARGAQGQHCIEVFDIAVYDSTIKPLQAAQTYTIEVSHP
jgi:hypothetical protein